MAKPIFKRILLKLSGEALQGRMGFGIDDENIYVANRIAVKGDLFSIRRPSGGAGGPNPSEGGQLDRIGSIGVAAIEFIAA